SVARRADRRGADGARLLAGRHRGAQGRGRGGGSGGGGAGLVPVMSPAAGNGDAPRENGYLKMRELAAASGVSAGTIKHYLREGLLPEPVRTSRNMAYYPPEFVERIKLIKQLQEDRFMPLKVIKRMLDDDPERARALIEIEDRILEHALKGEERSRVSAAAVRKRYDIPQDVLERLA